MHNEFPNNSRRFIVPVIWCVISALLFGASTPSAKFLLTGIGSITLAGLLYIGAALAVLPFAFRGGSRELRKAPKNIFRLVMVIFFGGVLGPMLLMVGLRLAPSASVALWLNLESVATAVLGYMFFKEHVGGRSWIAVAMVVIAGVLLSSPENFSFVLPALFVAFACLCWGVDNNFTAILDGYTPAQTTLIKGLVAGTLNFSFGLLFCEPLPGIKLLGLALLVGIFGYGVSLVLYVMGAQELGATRSQLVFSLAPYFGVLISWTLLGETIHIQQVVAGIVMLGGIGFLFSERHSHYHLHHPMTHTHLHSHSDGHHDHFHGSGDSEHVHTHSHEHVELSHSHPHSPDLHHRHKH